MLARDVVEHEVEHEADPCLPQLGGQGAQVVHGAQVGAHRPVVGHRVAAVVVALARLQQRHEVQVRHAELAQVVDRPPHAVEVAGEPVGVRGVPEHARVLEPVRRQGALLVEPVQLRVALGVGTRGGGDEVGQEGRVAGVHGLDAVAQVGPPALEPQLEQLAPGAVEALERRHRGRSDVRRDLGHGTNLSREAFAPLVIVSP